MPLGTFFGSFHGNVNLLSVYLGKGLASFLAKAEMCATVVGRETKRLPHHVDARQLREVDATLMKFVSSWLLGRSITLGQQLQNTTLSFSVSGILLLTESLSAGAVL